MPDIASLIVFPLFLVFVRLGGAIMVFPAFSDISINVRTRLLVAVFTALAMFPVLEPTLPLLPEKTSQLVTFIGVEIFIGVALAVGARIFMAGTNLAGELIGFSIGFQAASLFDPRSGANTVAPALFLGITVVTLIFVMDIHHLMIQGVHDSYQAFPPGKLPLLEDTAFAVAQVMGQMFWIGIKIAAPAMVAGFLVYIGFGIFNRLIPQMHMFFVAMPLTIMIGLLMLGAAVAGMLTLFMDELSQRVVLFTQEIGR